MLQRSKHTQQSKQLKFPNYAVSVRDIIREASILCGLKEV